MWSVNDDTGTQTRGGTHMHRKAVIWLTLAVATASLVFATGASAVIPAGDAGGTTGSTVTDSSGATWSNVTIGVALAIALVLVGLGAAGVLRNRGRLATAH
jgi:hypothetical protein